MEKKPILEILEELIKINTTNPPGNEMLAAGYLYELFKKNHISVELQDLGNNRANLIASYGQEGPEIVFCGHLDVVPAAEGWTYEPFEMTKSGNKLYGRGTSDMKGGIAVMSAVLIKLAQKKAVLNGKLTLVLVADEEASNIGMIHFLRKKRDVLFAIIGEPTELKIATAHRGVLRDYIDIVGTAYHAALPAQEDNVMKKTAEAIMSIFQLNEKLKLYKHEILPPPSIAVTMVEGYENDNIIPANVRLLTDFRILPGMKFEQCRNLEEESLAEIEDYQVESHFFMPGGEVSMENSVVKILCKLSGEVLGEEQYPVAFDASCEQCFMIEQGIPTVICGPGSLKQAHTIDEYIEEEQLYLAENFYEKVVNEYLI